MSRERSVNIGGDAVGNVITTGDGNKGNAAVDVGMVKATLPPATSVDILNELAQIRAILEQVAGEHRSKIVRALDDADEEARKPHPDKNEIGSAVGRAIDYAKKGNTLANELDKLVPRVTNVVAWLGSNWHNLLPLVGITSQGEGFGSGARNKQN